MRKSLTAALVLTAVLAAVPAGAAPRDRSDRPSLTIIKKFILKMFGVSTTADPTVPIPDPPKP